MEALQPGTVNVRTLSPLALAFVGDGVYELMVRERLVREANRPAGVLHKRAVELVRAEAQAAAMERLLPLLTEEEAAAYRRDGTPTPPGPVTIITRPPAWRPSSVICICRDTLNRVGSCLRRP